MVLPSPFAHDVSFWKALGWSVFFGVVIAFAALGFLVAVETVPHKWMEETTSSYNFMGGHWWWILVPTGGGFVIGLLRYILRIPNSLPSFMDEIKEGHVEPRTAVPVVLICGISVGCGASLSPESGLAAMGGGLATWLGSIFHSSQPEIVRQLTLIGMASAFGGLLTSPVLATILVIEISSLPLGSRRMQTGYCCLVAACFNFSIFYPIAGKGFLDIYAMSDYDEKIWFLGYALIFGVVGSIANLVIVLVLAIFKRTVAVLHDSRFGTFFTVFLPTVAGALTGVIGMAYPLALGTGSSQLLEVINNYHHLGLKTVVLSAMLRLITFALAIHCGFIGGTIFPLIFMGGSLGILVHMLFPSIPLALSFGCLSVAIPGGLVRAPFTFLFLVSLTMGITMIHMTSIAVAMLTTYFVLHGLGTLNFLESVTKPKSSIGEDNGSIQTEDNGGIQTEDKALLTAKEVP